MGAAIPSEILDYQGQVIKKGMTDEDTGLVHTGYCRDRRRRSVDVETKRHEWVSRLKRRIV